MFNKGSLGKSLQAYTSSGAYPFHMPGHKRNPDFLPIELCKYDVTELPGFDNLMNPAGVLRDIENRLAKISGSSQSFLLVNGSTAGVLAAILHAVPSGSFIMARNCHRSAYSAAALAGLEPYYVMPETSDTIIGGITPAAVEKTFAECQSARAVVVTSPTYEGVVSDIRGIAEIARRHDAFLIVDEAHGAHFGSHEYFPASAVSQGADIVIQSLHKALPALSQLGAVHISGRVSADGFRRTLNMLQTSSPSYVLMAQAEDMLERLSSARFDEYAARLGELRKKIIKIPGISLVGEDFRNKNGVFDVDRSKLAIIPSFCSGTELYDSLRECYGLWLEHSSDLFALAYSTIADTDEGFSRLYTALSGISCKNGTKMRKISYSSKLILPKRHFSVRDTLQMPCERVKIEEAEDHVCASYVIPYPPGIPLAVPGEDISAEITGIINELLNSGASVIGVYDGLIDIVRC